MDRVAEIRKRPGLAGRPLVCGHSRPWSRPPPDLGRVVGCCAPRSISVQAYFLPRGRTGNVRRPSEPPRLGRAGRRPGGLDTARLCSGRRAARASIPRRGVAASGQPDDHRSVRRQGRDFRGETQFADPRRRCDRSDRLGHSGGRRRRDVPPDKPGADTGSRPEDRPSGSPARGTGLQAILPCILTELII